MERLSSKENPCLLYSTPPDSVAVLKYYPFMVNSS